MYLEDDLNYLLYPLYFVNLNHLSKYSLVYALIIDKMRIIFDKNSLSLNIFYSIELFNNENVKTYYLDCNENYLY